MKIKLLAVTLCLAPIFPTFTSKSEQKIAGEQQEKVMTKRQNPLKAVEFTLTEKKSVTASREFAMAVVIIPLLWICAFVAAVYTKSPSKKTISDRAITDLSRGLIDFSNMVIEGLT